MVAVRRARPADAPALARVYVDSWRTTYPGIVPDSYLAAMSPAAWETHWRRVLQDPEGRQILRCAFVADSDHGVVGFATGCREWSGDGEYEGELDDLYLLRPYQGRGLGRLLVARVAGQLQRDGLGSLLAWVAARNPACAFYEALGGQRLERCRRIRVGGAGVDVVAYGWRALGRLASAAPARPAGTPLGAGATPAEPGGGAMDLAAPRGAMRAPVRPRRRWTGCQCRG